MLLVEDDDDMRAIVRRAFELAGHPLIECARGDEVYDTLEAVRVDAIILDKELPGRDGLELLQALRWSHPKVPVIFVTAHGGPDVQQRALQAGAAYYLEKPFRLSHLLEVVGSVVRPVTF
jgi:DNA-binding response OmpR family regulator